MAFQLLWPVIVRLVDIECWGAKWQMEASVVTSDCRKQDEMEIECGRRKRKGNEGIGVEKRILPFAIGIPAAFSLSSTNLRRGAREPVTLALLEHLPQHLVLVVGGLAVQRRAALGDRLGSQPRRQLVSVGSTARRRLRGAGAGSCEGAVLGQLGISLFGEEERLPDRQCARRELLNDGQVA